MATAVERKEFGTLLRRLRGDRSLQQLANELIRERGLNTSTSQLSGWERGEYAPKNRDVVAVLDDHLDAGGALLDILGLAGPLALTSPATSERLEAIEERLAALEELLGVGGELDPHRVLDRIEHALNRLAALKGADQRESSAP